MIDDRSLAWSHLLPTRVSYLPTGGPEWWRARLRELSVPDGAPVPVLWGNAPLGAGLGTGSIGLVVVNPGAEVLDKLSTLGFAYVRKFAVLPRLSDARWFVPCGSRRLGAAALQLYIPWRWKARAAHTAFRVAARFGVSPLRQDQVVIASRDLSPVEKLFQEVLDSNPAALAISTGNPGPARKTTVAALDRAGRIRAVCKLATTPLARRLVRNEAACMSLLARHTELAAHAPRLLADRKLEDAHAIVVEGIEGRRAGLRLTPLHHHILSLLASGHPQPATTSRFFADLARRTQALQERGVPVRQLLEWARSILEDIALPRTIVHGDFAPWNLRICRGELKIFDWEYGQCDGLPLLDEIHHLIQVGFLVHGWSVTRAQEELRRHAAEGRLGLGRECIEALQAVYLLDAYLRRVEEGHPATDSLLAKQAELVAHFAHSKGLAVA